MKPWFLLRIFHGSNSSFLDECTKGSRSKFSKVIAYSYSIKPLNRNSLLHMTEKQIGWKGWVRRPMLYRSGVCWSHGHREELGSMCSGHGDVLLAISGWRESILSSKSICHLACQVLAQQNAWSGIYWRKSLKTVMTAKRFRLRRLRWIFLYVALYFIS